MKTKKAFDCVEMKRWGAERIHDQIANMTIEEQLVFWQKRTELLRKHQQSVKARRKTSLYS